MTAKQPEPARSTPKPPPQPPRQEQNPPRQNPPAGRENNERGQDNTGRGRDQDHDRREQRTRQHQDKLWDLAKKQSQERRDLARKHTEAQQDVDEDDDEHLAELKTAHTNEMAALRKRQNKELQDADPDHTLPTFAGYDIQEKVTQLHAELQAVADDHRFYVGELRNWDMEFDVLDPVTGMLISPARAHRRDVGDLGILMTTEAVISDIETARKHQQNAGPTTYGADVNLQAQSHQ